MKWIARIILKDLKIGISHEQMLNFFHPDGLNFYNTTSSLKDLCQQLQDKQNRLDDVIQLFKPIKPMLSGKKKKEEISYLFNDKVFLIETKFDGERI